MARTTLNPGETFAGYRIEQVLGVGGMGTVYKAADPELPRSVALKLLHRDLTADDYIRSRFELEAAHAARLEHPNIVSVYRRGREGDQLWIAMQYLDTTDAADAVRTGPLDPAHAVHVITETAKALDHAHAAGVLHRDVKPANILLERSRPGRPGRVLLADFGISKALAETGHLTRTGMMVLSMQYASPEQFDNVELDRRADEYSLGCTLFHLLTGRVPYPGDTLPQLWAGHVKAPIPRPSALRPDLPPALDAVIERAMAKDRADRYPSCGDFAAAATAALHPDTAHAHPTVVIPASTTRYDRGPTPDHTYEIAPAGPRPQWAEPPQRRSRYLWLVALVVVLLGGGISAAFFLTRDQAKQTELPFAGLSRPVGVAVDRAGAVFVVDSKNNRVLKLAAGSSSQTVLPFTGLNEPSAVAVSDGGDVFVTDTKNNRVLQLAPSGSVSELPVTGLSLPAGVAVARNGDLYVVDSDNSRVFLLPAGTRTQTVLPASGLAAPAGLALSATGDIFVADTGNNRVVVFRPGSAEPTVLPFAGLASPTGVAVNDAGDVFVADHDNNRVVVIRAGATTSEVVPLADVEHPIWVAVNSAGDLFISAGNAVVRLSQ